MATSVGNDSDVPEGIADLWVGDDTDTAAHPAHAWVGDDNDNPQQVDKPTRLTVSDDSFCDESGEFPEVVIQHTWAWDNLHFGNVAHVELWVDDGGGWTEWQTEPVDSSGDRQTTGTLAGGPGGGGAGTSDCRVRYQYDDGSHSEHSDVAQVTITNPCF